MRVASGFNQPRAGAMEEWFLRHMPPDDDLVDLIEWAFLDGQIDGLKADLAYLWLNANIGRFSAQTLP